MLARRTALLGATLIALLAGCATPTPRMAGDRPGATVHPYRTVLVQLDIPNAAMRATVERSVRAAYRSRSGADSTTFVAAVDYDSTKHPTSGSNIDALLVLSPIGGISIPSPSIDHTVLAQCPATHAATGQCLAVASTDGSGVLLFNACCQLTATMHDLRDPHVVWSTTMDAGIQQLGTPGAADPTAVFSDIAAATVRLLQHDRLVN